MEIATFYKFVTARFTDAGPPRPKLGRQGHHSGSHITKVGFSVGCRVGGRVRTNLYGYLLAAVLAAVLAAALGQIFMVT